MNKYLFTALLCALLITGCVDKRKDRFAALEDIPSDYSLEQAKADGCVVFENSDITSGENFWDSFAEQSKRGKEAYVRYCSYYTIKDPSRYSPEYYEEIKDDYPKMYIHDLTFDGDIYTVRWYEDDTEIVREYKYLMKYEGEPESDTATYKYYTKYVLTNDDTVSWQDISYGMYSSQFGDYIDHLTVYNDYVYKDE